VPSPIIARADALMQRRRQSNTGPDEVPILTDALDDDDVPILLEVDAAAPAPPAPPAPLAPTAPEPAEPPGEEAAEPPPRLDTPPMPPNAEAALGAGLASSLDEAVVRELARRIEERLASELPRIIEATVRDYLAHRKMPEITPPRP